MNHGSQVNYPIRGYLRWCRSSHWTAENGPAAVGRRRLEEGYDAKEQPQRPAEDRGRHQHRGRAAGLHGGTPKDTERWTAHPGRDHRPRPPGAAAGTGQRTRARPAVRRPISALSHPSTGAPLIRRQGRRDSSRPPPSAASSPTRPVPRQTPAPAFLPHTIKLPPRPFLARHYQRTISPGNGVLGHCPGRNANDYYQHRQANSGG